MQVSKQFSMNPNANVFRSVYEPTSACVADSKSVVQAGSELNGENSIVVFIY